MLDLSDLSVQVGFALGFIIYTLILIFIFGKSQKEKVQKLTQKLQTQEEKIDTLNNKLIEAQDKLFKQGATTKSTSFVHEQIKKIETLQDDLKQTRQRLHEAKIIAQEANMVKYDFLSNIRHEVRTPMNSILVFADMLRSNIKDKTQLSYANNIFTSGHKLLELLDKIIELSHLESGSFTLNEKAVDSHLLFNQLIDTQKEKAYKKGLELSLDIDEKLPSSLILDDEKVTEILTNLVDNAIKFTQSGSVTIDVKVDDANVLNNTINISISVSDTGMGISEENQKKIFEIFEKREDGTELEYQGTGLGLSINRKTARHMKGDISVKSTLNEGSIFTLSLTNVEIVLADNSEISEDEIDFNLIKSAKLMFVDEDEKSLQVFEESFKGTQVEFLGFSKPREAIDALKKTSVDLLFIDVELLTVDEGVVSKMIATMSKAPVVSLTTKSLKDINFAKNGVDVKGHLQKPVTKLSLFKICMQLLNSSHLLKSQTQAGKDTNIFSEVDNHQARGFLNALNEEVIALYKKAHKTKDLNECQYFANALEKLAKKHQIPYFESYANSLVKKIELFDIAGIEALMDNFQELINLLKTKAA
jgi:signal transduction histidine kinase/CheY-like chemotaxis protein